MKFSIKDFFSKCDLNHRKLNTKIIFIFSAFHMLLLVIIDLLIYSEICNSHSKCAVKCVVVHFFGMTALLILKHYYFGLSGFSVFILSSSRPEVCCKTGVLKNFTNPQNITCAVFFHKSCRPSVFELCESFTESVIMNWKFKNFLRNFSKLKKPFINFKK